MQRLSQYFKPPSQSSAASWGFLLLRIVAGLAMMMHGWGKIQAPMSWMGAGAPVPGIFQALAALSEFGGGLFWILGLLTPLASLGIFFTMAVATYTHAIQRGDPFVGTGPTYEPALLFLSIAVLFFAAGPGRYSVDQKVFGSR
jgi:putative oxidoreductase